MIRGRLIDSMCMGKDAYDEWVSVANRTNNGTLSLGFAYSIIDPFK